MTRTPLASLTCFADREALVAALVAIIAEPAYRTIAFSGGGTPKRLLEALRCAGFDKAIELVDDRCVPPDHPDSNRGLLLRHLGRLPEPLSPTGRSAADLILLGLGADGHTASLFPGQAATDAAFRDDAPDYLATSPNLDDGNVQVARLSMTAAPMRRAKRVILHIEGEAKRATLAEVLARPDLPFSRIARDPGITLDLFWAP